MEQIADREKIIQLVLSAVDEINEQLPHGKKLGTSIDTVLFGKSGQLDSLGLVNLIIATEQILQEKLEVTVTLADQRAMSQKSSPFRTIGTLADYISLILEEDGRGS